MRVDYLKIGLAILFGLLFNVTDLYAQENKILNNDRLRIGNGNQNSINTYGNMEQPFYYNGSEYRKLTYATYPLDIQWGIGGDGTQNWNTSGSLTENPALANQVFDYSNFTITNAATGDGYGQIRTYGDITINGQDFRVENIYELLQPEGYIAIKVKITNMSASNAENVRLWVGTRDDYVGGSDGPTKERGNLIDEEFVTLNNQADQAKAIKISTTEEAILFFSNSDRAYSTINRCCSFGNATNQNPATNNITETGDGSYALYVRFNDLAANESDELIWYYGAGTLPEIDEIIARVANAAIGAFDNVTYNSADYTARINESGTGYWILVPDESPVPTSEQIENGVDYNGVTLIGSGNSPMQADQEHIFSLNGLTPSTDYDFYFVAEYFDGAEDTYTEIISEDLTTLEAPPTLTSFSPNNAAFGEMITLSGSHFLTTNNVLVGGLNASFTVIDENTVEVIVPDGAQDSYIELANESGTATIESENTGNGDDSCSTGWSGAWQTISSNEDEILRSVTLKLANTDVSADYDLYLELYDTDDNPGSANPSEKFTSLVASSAELNIGANSNAAEFEFLFESNPELTGNENYYVVLKERASNPAITGGQSIYLSCDGNDNGGAGNNFSSLYHSFVTNPVFHISNPPSDVTLAPNTIMENNLEGAVIGSFSSVDADNDDSHVYMLVAGIGDEDNDHFTIDGNGLKANAVYDYETKNSYSIRILSTDEDGNEFQKNLIVTISDDVDEDNDGIPESTDNCPDTANANQTDTDSDGTGDLCDLDDDNDGTPDTEDAFPLDENEDTDTDGDGTGDIGDTDDDGDGTPDSEDAFPLDENEDTDTDGDGTGDNGDTDDDGDGTPDSEDAFPLDENEDTDTDGDGTGDNGDTDDDGDGTPDSEDAFPLDENEDTDTDGDGTGDNIDNDDDNDGILDIDDEFPNDPNEWSDIDEDGIGDNADTDDDDDGEEDIDTDGDGLGDNVDEDDDNDGIWDTEDDFPLDETETIDTDGDGTGDNADTDDDGDGYSDEQEIEHGTDATDSMDTPADNDNDGIPDTRDEDDDNDGIPDITDYFPYDSKPTLSPAEAFTPNGDGMNDAWVVPGIENYPNNSVRVYNRYGHEVFAQKGYRNDWQGFFKDKNEKLPSGSYLYVIDLGNDEAPLKGWIFVNY